MIIIVSSLDPSTSSSNTILAVSSVVLFLVGVVGGFAAGTLSGYCCARRSRHWKPHPPAPLYEDVGLTTATQRPVQEELKLKDNVAYGHFN